MDSEPEREMEATLESDSEGKECRYGCGKSYLTKEGKLMNSYNISFHEKSCPERKKREQKQNEKVAGKKRKGPITGPINNFFKPTKKATLPDNSARLKDVDPLMVDSADTDTTLELDLISPGPIRVDSVEDTAVEEVICVSATRNFCKGYSPNDEVYELFPFQLLPTMKTKVFKNNSFHHVDCMKHNYVLQNQSTGDSGDETNTMCARLSDESNLKTIVERSVKPFQELATFNNRFLNHRQLSNKCVSYRQDLRNLRLDNMNMVRKINRLGRTLDMHQRFMLSISQHNVPRLQQLVAVALRNKRSIQYIVSKVVNAIDGIYLARPSQDDKELAYLILQFGGPALVDICHHANALPSSSTAYRMAK